MMIKQIQITVAALGALFMLSCFSHEACSAEVDIFMIGNSYTDDSGSLGTYDEMLLFAESATRLYGAQFDVQFNVTSNTFGGRTIYGASNVNVGTNTYEHIILQEQSQRLADAYSWFPTQLNAGQNFFDLHRSLRGWPGSEAAISNTSVDLVYYGWYRMLNNKIKVNSPNSMVHIFQTWGRTSGFIGGSYDEHIRRNVILADDIQEEASAMGLNAIVGRAGEAWDHIFDTTSLTLHRDGSHANAQGYYLAAATLFQNILNQEMPGISVADLDYNPHGTTGETLLNAAILMSGVVSTPKVLIVESEGSTDVTEGGNTDNYTVKLNESPASDVTVNLTTDAQVTVFPTSLTFTAGDWDTPQTVTVTAVDDSDLENTHSGTVSHSTSSSDSNWNAMTVNDLTVTITDDEVAVTYTISYDGNGNTSGTAPADQTKTQGIGLTLADPGDLTRSGYAFTGWNTASNGSGTTYASGASYTTDGSTTLFARWAPVTTTVLVGGSTLNGNFNANSADDVTFADTPSWYNLAGDQNVQCTRTNLDHDGTSNHVLANSKSAAVDTGYVISEGDVFDLSYVWRDAYQWVDGSDRVRVSLFVTDDNTLTGTRTNLVEDLSGTSTQNDTYEAVNHDAFYTAQATDADKTLFVVIEADTSAGFARVDDFELIVTHTSTNTLASWISGYDVGGLTGIDDDYDDDGIPNGLENYFGTDPTTTSGSIEAGAVNRGNNTFTFTHPVNDNPASDLTAAYIWSKNLTQFHADGASSNGTTVTFVQGTPSGGMVTVTATITGPAEHIFVAIQVTQN